MLLPPQKRSTVGATREHKSHSGSVLGCHHFRRGYEVVVTVLQLLVDVVVVVLIYLCPVEQCPQFSLSPLPLPRLAEAAK